MATDEFYARGNPAMDQHPIQRWGAGEGGERYSKALNSTNIGISAYQSKRLQGKENSMHIIISSQFPYLFVG